ncbi:MAG: helix-turn-helix transcriptional regulator [Mycobacteriales bacterium]
MTSLLAEPTRTTATWEARGGADTLRRRELGAFLRSRRERISPEQVGLPPAGRRRTPGLRREEVAQLAAVGVTWYTWLEQGRDITVSDQVLEAVSRTLMFDPHERSHLYTLAGSPQAAVGSECQVIRPAVQLLLDQVAPYPASVVNARMDILAYNRSYGRLVDDLDALAYQERNSLWLMFTKPQWREVMVDWDDSVRRLVAQYRAAMAEHVAEPAWKCLLKRLQLASPEFARRWDEHEVQAPENRTKRVLHKDVGLLNLDYTYLWFGQRLGTRMTTYTPADPETAVRLRRLQELTRTH